MGLFSRLTSKATESLPRTSPGTAERIKNILGIQKLESMPVQAAQAFQIASDPKAKQDDFVKVIEADEALSARIIRVANSVYFFRGTKATDIENAVNNIGLEELRCLISATMLKSLLHGQSEVREAVWANAVATGIACREIASLGQDISTGSAFLCGLLHDVGKLIMIQRGGRLYEKVLTLLAAEEISPIEAEERVFELNHVEVGKWIAEHWNFPEPVIVAISFHHQPWHERNTKQPAKLGVAQLVKCADTICHAAGIGHTRQFKPYRLHAEENLPHALELLQWDQVKLESFSQTLKEKFERDFALYKPEGNK